jgi:hypothetical protein
VIAYLDYEDDCCPSCGLLREECQDKAAQFSFEAAPIRCHATWAREFAAEEFAKAKGDTRGLLFGVRRRSLDVS